MFCSQVQTARRRFLHRPLVEARRRDCFLTLFRFPPLRLLSSLRCVLGLSAICTPPKPNGNAKTILRGTALYVRSASPAFSKLPILNVYGFVPVTLTSELLRRAEPH